MPENQYLNFINYQRAEPLKSHIGNDPIAASVADIILYKWQNSQITFKGGKACCPALVDIACAVGVSVKTVTRKIVKLVKLGLISKTLGRWANGATRLYFKVTDLFVGLITGEIKKEQKETKKSPQAQCSSDLDKLSKSTKTICPSPINKEKETKEKKEKNNNPIVANKEPKEGGNTKNKTAVTVNFQQVEKEVVVTQSSAKPTPQKTTKPDAKPKDKNPYLIGDKLTKRQIAIAHGAVNNLIKNGVPVSNPKQLKAEVVFKIEQKHKDAGGNNLQHQINSAMKLIRAGKWTTPHGFYKYSEIGLEAVKKREEVERAAEESKYDASVPTLPDHFKDLLKLNLSGVGQGDDAVRVNGQYDNADTRQNEPCVSGNNKAGIDVQVATENDDTGTTNLSWGRSIQVSRLNVLNDNIARYQERLKSVTGSANDMLSGLIDRCLDEVKLLSI
ncbi:MAG TPA: hypothetical protein DDY16_07735 [Tenacibaculum sp.]|nr:hypothetical protein [Tenacibaculum sp.]